MTIRVYENRIDFGNYSLAITPTGLSVKSTNSNRADATGITNYSVTNSGVSAYVINGSNNPTLNLLRGFTYEFNVNASGHPFWIQTVAAPFSSGNAYSSGVTNNGTQSGTITFVVPNNAPSTLYYVCQNHASMNGTINITDVVNTIDVTGTLTAAAIQYLNYPFQGTVAGFTSGGWQPPAYNVIDRFPFADPISNAYDHGDLTQARCFLATQSSSTHGYASAGYLGPPGTNVIDKFTFVVNQNATDVGDLTQGRYGPSGQSSNTAGYTSGGIVPGVSNVIDKFPFSTDTNASDVGDLTQARYYSTGHSSGTHGYVAGGVSSNIIDKFPFATNANASDVGDILSSSAYQIATGLSSQHHGYVAGGGWPGSNSNVIQRFSFITNQNSVDIADMTAGRYGSAGVSDTLSGYISGGATAPYTVQNIIERFPFAASEGTYLCRDVGDLTVSRGYMSGQQD